MPEKKNHIMESFDIKKSSYIYIYGKLIMNCINSVPPSEWTVETSFSLSYASRVFLCMG